RRTCGTLLMRRGHSPISNGILMANSLHDVEDPVAFSRGCEPRMKGRRSFLIVEYDSDEASRWVPYPLSQATLATVFAHADCAPVVFLRSRRSVYGRAPLYWALITCPGLQRLSPVLNDAARPTCSVVGSNPERHRRNSAFPCGQQPHA